MIQEAAGAGAALTVVPVPMKTLYDLGKGLAQQS